MKRHAAGLAILGAAMMTAGQAEAGVNEAYVGVMQHNICVLDCKNADKEEGPNITFQVNFDSPGFLEWAFSPKPMIMASINTQGDTSYAGFGLDWRFNITDNWSIDPSFGYVIHNGENSNPYPNNTPEAAEFADNHVLLGSDDLFRTGLGLTYHFDNAWMLQGYFEHLSHGQILGEGRNQGLDEFGLRLGYRFGE
ncbi:MAG: acyloxyacyl hydrolase [Hyphomonadaceae bacterium]|nr:acyloxyacyl hydrolase [Hyphomonadaceae bacterium]